MCTCHHEFITLVTHVIDYVWVVCHDVFIWHLIRRLLGQGGETTCLFRSCDIKTGMFTRMPMCDDMHDG